MNKYTRIVHTSDVQTTYIWDMTKTQLLLSDALVSAAILYKEAPESAKPYLKMEHLNRTYVMCIHRGLTEEQASDILNKVLND